MKLRCFIPAGVALVLAICGCGGKPGANAVAGHASEAPRPPQAAQPRLRTLKLWVGGAELLAEVARQPRQIETGMMFRTNIAENEAMLFVFEAPQRRSFWMKNVPIPLSCAYIDPEGEILELHDMEPQNVIPIVSSATRVQYVLETARGWFDRHGVKPGALVRTDQGTLRETFAGPNGWR